MESLIYSQRIEIVTISLSFLLIPIFIEFIDFYCKYFDIRHVKITNSNKELKHIKNYYKHNHFEYLKLLDYYDYDENDYEPDKNEFSI